MHAAVGPLILERHLPVYLSVPSLPTKGLLWRVTGTSLLIAIPLSPGLLIAPPNRTSLCAAPACTTSSCSHNQLVPALSSCSSSYFESGILAPWWVIYQHLYTRSFLCILPSICVCLPVPDLLSCPFPCQYHFHIISLTVLC